MYSIRFPSSSPTHIPPDTYRKGRKVFHVPDRSHYVFTRAIRHLKGTDASNQHDEEVGESDQEDFSDDEKEREWKARRKGKGRDRGGRPPQFADQPRPTDDGDYPFNSSYYDEEPGASSSRPPQRDMRAPPAPYDDMGSVPYDDADDDAMSVASSTPAPNHEYSRGRGGGRPRGRGGRDRGSGRGRGRGRGFPRGRGGGGGGGFRGGHPSPQQDFTFTPPPMDNTQYDPRHNVAFMPQHHFPQPPQQQQPFYGGMPMGHINPNFFAAAMMGGMNMGQMGQMGWGYPMGMMGGGPQGMMPPGAYQPQQQGGGWNGDGQEYPSQPPGPGSE